MKKILLPAMILTFVCGIALAEGGAKKGECPLAKAAKEGKKDLTGHDCPAAKAAMAAQAAKPKKCGGMCPEKLKGVEKTVKNIETGVEVTFTAKDKETAAKVQEMAAKNSGPKAAGEKDCDCRMEGSETKVTNTETGVIMQITGGTPEMIKKIQDASAKEHKCGLGEKAQGKGKKEAKKAAKYICPMKCPGSESGKPGKCPKCGMDLVEKK